MKFLDLYFLATLFIQIGNSAGTGMPTGGGLMPCNFNKNDCGKMTCTPIAGLKKVEGNCYQDFCRCFSYESRGTCTTTEDCEPFRSTCATDPRGTGIKCIPSTYQGHKPQCKCGCYADKECQPCPKAGQRTYCRDNHFCNKCK